MLKAVNMTPDARFLQKMHTQNNVGTSHNVNFCQNSRESERARERIEVCCGYVLPLCRVLFIIYIVSVVCMHLSKTIINIINNLLHY